MPKDFLDGALLRHTCTAQTRVGHLFHKHKCPKCETVWAHLDALPALVDFGDLTSEEFDVAHSCPKCGTEQRDRLQDGSDVVKLLHELMGGWAP